jgi:hypothetical protein
LRFSGRKSNLEIVMKKYLALATASLLLSVSSMDAAFARHHHRSSHHVTQGATTGMNGGGSSMKANNAELGGNNANSGSGPNSLGHIQGGNNGAGK